MSTKREDLRVALPYLMLGSGKDWRPATIADVLDWLIAEGGEIRGAGHDLVAREWRLVSYVVDEPGDYLVYGPIPVESAEAKEA